VASLALSAWSPSNDPTRIPEVRHNVRLIADACKSDLDGLAREAKTLQERNKFVTGEDFRLRKKVDDEAQRNFFRTSGFNSLILFCSDCTPSTSSTPCQRYKRDYQGTFFCL